jgi:hypothetical protein
VILCFVDIGGIDDHHSLILFVLLILVELMTITPSIPPISTKRIRLKSDGHQFHQYQQNE